MVALLLGLYLFGIGTVSVATVIKIGVWMEL
jgi:hypothetical protein